MAFQTAFQPNAFQNNAFQIYNNPVNAGGGGWMNFGRTDRQKIEDYDDEIIVLLMSML